MEYIFLLLLTFIGMLLLMQLVFFEISRSKMKKANNMNWFLSLDRPFQYNRVGYMFFICLICYLFSSGEEIFTLSWFVYFILFLAMGIVADAVVQYITLIYAKKRCHKEIEDAKLLQNELLEISETMNDTDDYEQSPRQYDEEAILKEYVEPSDHIAFLSMDHGEFVSELTPLPEATFIVEPYGDIESIQSLFEDKPIKVTRLTSEGKMPFKDEKIDILMCQYMNYDKHEVQRVLKPGGYFIVNQNGTSHLKEFLKMYVPFGMKGTWDSSSCAQTLDEIGMRIVNKFEDYGTIRFHSLQSIHSYFKKYSPDMANINKYRVFYLNALKDIKAKGYYEMSTHRFLVVAQKLMN